MYGAGPILTHVLQMVPSWLYGRGDVENPTTFDLRTVLMFINCAATIYSSIRLMVKVAIYHKGNPKLAKLFSWSIADPSKPKKEGQGLMDELNQIFTCIFFLAYAVVIWYMMVHYQIHSAWEFIIIEGFAFS